MPSVTTLLIVDDEPAVRDLMSRWATSLGLRAKTAANADQALASLRLHQYDLAVIDVMMPGHDGLWLAAEVQREQPTTAIIVATAFTELLNDAARQTPIADFLIKPFQRERFELAVERARQWRQLALEEGHWHALLSIELRDRAAHVVRALDERVAAGEREDEALSALVEQRLPQVAAHGERVRRYAQSVARELDVEPAVQAELEIAARFHDVGKLAMPEPVIAKASLLTRRENAIMRRHTDVGAEILESTRTLASAAPAVRASHEWFQGGGYPQQSVGTEIPFASRLIAVADAYDAMTQERAYRARLDASEAVAEILRCSPSQFDPHIVDAFIAAVSRH